MARSKVVRRGGKVYSRSGLERSIMAGLDRDGVPYEYEKATFRIGLHVTGHSCERCGHKGIIQYTRYTPDFRPYPGTKGFYVEAKGRFTGRDRRKALAMKTDWPAEEVRYVFMRDNKLSKNSKTKYSDWCKDNGFKYHVGNEIPKGWLR